MNQSLNNLTRKVEVFSEKLSDTSHAMIQQVHSCAHFLSLQCRIPGKTLFIYLGRGVNYQGLDISEAKLPSQLKIQDRYLQFARKNWRGMRVFNARVSKLDRVFVLEGVIGSYKQRCFFFWRGRDLFFANIRIENNIVHIFRSWEGVSKLSVEQGSSINESQLFEDVGFGQVEIGHKDKDFDIKDYLEEFSPTKEAGSRKRSKLDKKLDKMKEELIAISQINDLYKYVDVNLDEYHSVGEGRFKVSFRGIEGHFKKREYLFDKLKSWKKSKILIEKRIDNLEQELNGKKTDLLEKRNVKVIQPIWNVTKHKSSLEKKENYIEFKYNGWRCFLGTSASENDFIRKTIASKDDWWIHLEGMKSGHLFCKTDSQNLNLEDVQVLASAIVEYCSVSIKEIPVVYTLVKNLKGVKGHTGMVNYKKEKHLKVYFDDNWRQKLTFLESTTND